MQIDVYRVMCHGYRRGDHRSPVRYDVWILWNPMRNGSILAQRALTERPYIQYRTCPLNWSLNRSLCCPYIIIYNSMRCKKRRINFEKLKTETISEILSFYTEASLKGRRWSGWFDHCGWMKTEKSWFAWMITATAFSKVDSTTQPMGCAASGVCRSSC